MNKVKIRRYACVAAHVSNLKPKLRSIKLICVHKRMFIHVYTDSLCSEFLAVRAVSCTDVITACTDSMVVPSVHLKNYTVFNFVIHMLKYAYR